MDPPPNNDHSESEEDEYFDMELLEDFDEQNNVEIPNEEPANIQLDIPANIQLDDLWDNNGLNIEEIQNIEQQEGNEDLPINENGPPLPHLIRLRDRLFDIFHWRPQRLRRGDLEFGVVRNWILRRRLRMNQNDDSNDSSNEEDNDESGRQDLKEFLNEMTFDRNLPTAHSYLGELEECSGVAYQDQDSYQTISLLYVHDFVLVPGQTLPLMLMRSNEVSMIRRIVGQPDKNLGILIHKHDSMLENEENLSSDLFDYGCTAEIRSFMDRESEISSITVVVVGRQKFKVISKRRQIDGNFLAKVKIFEDVRLPDMCSSVGLQRCTNFSQSYPPSLQDSYERKLNAIRRSSKATPWPPWVYKMYDEDFLKMQIFSELREWNQTLEQRHCPREASDFSFWVITNLPITDKNRLQLLRMESAEQRMRYELHLLQKCTLLACTDCGQQIAKRNDVFSMSASGPMAAYVNPGGMVHETLTLYKVSGLYLRGWKSEDHSWFPGYAWTICECRNCSRHMGWKFTATKSDMNPKKFWGLTRSALKPKVNISPGNESDASSDETSLLDD